jgi:single-strand DNA-binding protein
MNNLNSILIEGNLVRDPELSYTPKGTALCKFAVACNRTYKQDEEIQKEVSFFDVTVWLRQAEVCAEYLKKGRGVRVVGRLKQDRWTDPDGKPHSRVYVIAEHVEFKPGKKPDDKQGDEKPEDEKEETAAEEQEELAEVS